ncbi:hypothetical protein O1Q98_02645 [Dickeya lacustris]|uniref:Uncharacterized protein n=1 Tax=Dickeya lacustris TaxID=2259638 RepID=A0ABY8G8E9_9GAMM|nr:hypothetical protein [Dickeya lacustris]WFN56228.1 hypothetical protein O1Q98_02645 [Dickeya lacustris]
MAAGAGVGAGLADGDAAGTERAGGRGDGGHGADDGGRGGQRGAGGEHCRTGCHGAVAQPLPVIQRGRTRAHPEQRHGGADGDTAGRAYPEQPESGGGRPPGGGDTQRGGVADPQRAVGLSGGGGAGGVGCGGEPVWHHL